METKEEILESRIEPLIALHNMTPIADIRKQPEYEVTLNAMEVYAIQKVEERNEEFRDFLFNMHTVRDGKITLFLVDILKFLPPKS